jgi:hypothetical protein
MVALVKEAWLTKFRVQHTDMVSFYIFTSIFSQ